MDLEHAEVALAEARVGSELDVVGACGGVGDDAVVEAHVDRRPGFAEELVETGLQHTHRFASIVVSSALFFMAKPPPCVRPEGERHHAAGLPRPCEFATGGPRQRSAPRCGEGERSGGDEP